MSVTNSAIFNSRKKYLTPHIRLHAASEQMVKCYIAFASPKKDLSVLSGGHDNLYKENEIFVCYSFRALDSCWILNSVKYVLPYNFMWLKYVQYAFPIRNFCTHIKIWKVTCSTCCVIKYFMSFCRILSTLCRQVVFHIVPHFSRGRQKRGTKSTS